MRPRILIAGGYGLVGGQIARLLRDAGHDVELLLAGRNPDKGEALAHELAAQVIRLDVANPVAGLVEAGAVDIVVAALQDPGDKLLTATLRSGASHVGIVGMADSVASAVIAACQARPVGTALFLGHWQAGVLVAAAQAVARNFAIVDRVELAALYDYADPIGPMTANDAGSFVGRTILRRDGAWVRVDAQDEQRRITREGAPAFDAAPTGVLDVLSLAAVTGAQHVRFDLGFGESLGTLAGDVASHDLYIDIEGTLASGEVARRRWWVSDPQGQAHLTALGVLIGVERVLGLDGADPPAGGVAFPETLLDPGRTLARLADFGVRIVEGPPP